MKKSESPRPLSRAMSLRLPAPPLESVPGVRNAPVMDLTVNGRLPFYSIQAFLVLQRERITHMKSANEAISLCLCHIFLSCCDSFFVFCIFVHLQEHSRSNLALHWGVEQNAVEMLNLMGITCNSVKNVKQDVFHNTNWFSLRAESHQMNRLAT